MLFKIILVLVMFLTTSFFQRNYGRRIPTGQLMCITQTYQDIQMDNFFTRSSSARQSSMFLRRKSCECALRIRNSNISLKLKVLDCLFNEVVRRPTKNYNSR